MKKYIAAALTSTLVLAGACQDNPAAPSRDNVVAGSQQTLQSLTVAPVFHLSGAAPNAGSTGAAYGTRELSRARGTARCPGR